MSAWFRKTWPVGAGILLAAGMILICSLFTHRGKVPDKGWVGAPTVRHGLVSQHAASQSLKSILILTKASIKQTATQWSRAVNANHPLEILFDGEANQNPEFRYEPLPIGSLPAEPFIESGDPRIQDLMSELSGPEGNRTLTINY